MLAVTLAAAVWPSRGAAQLTPFSVAETSHEIDVTLRHGLARVTERIRIRNREPGAEVACYDLPAGRPAAIVDLRVCRGTACRAGRRAPDGGSRVFDDAIGAPLPANGRPIALATGTPDGASVCVAPVDDQRDVDVRVTWVVRTETYAGRTILDLPPRAPPRLRRENGGGRYVAAPLTVHAPDHANVVAPPEMDAHRLLRIAAELAPGAVTRNASVASCGGRRCVRLHLAAGVDPARSSAPLDVVLAFDFSGSMEAIREQRVLATADAVLAQLPAGSTVRAIAFASRASWIWQTRRAPARARAELAAAVREPRLVGNRTRFAAAADLLRQSGALGSAGSDLGPGADTGAGAITAPLVIVIGDGQLDDDDASPIASAPGTAVATAAGIRVAYLSVGDSLDDAADAVALAHRTGGAAVHVGGAATLGGETLATRVAAALAPIAVTAIAIDHDGARTVVAPLRAGEDIEVIVGADRARVLAGGRELPIRAAAGASARAVAAHSARVVGTAAPIVAASRFDLVREAKAVAADQTYVPREGAGMVRRIPHLHCCGGTVQILGGISREASQRMMRRLEPRVRGCLAAERAGRRDWSARIVYSLLLTEREVRAVQVDGAQSERLRDCLVAAVDDLVVPDGDGGVVLLRYPFVAVPEPEPEEIALRPDVAAELDDAIARIPVPAATRAPPPGR